MRRRLSAETTPSLAAGTRPSRGTAASSSRAPRPGPARPAPSRAGGAPRTALHAAALPRYQPPARPRRAPIGGHNKEGRGSGGGTSSDWRRRCLEAPPAGRPVSPEPGGAVRAPSPAAGRRGAAAAADGPPCRAFRPCPPLCEGPLKIKLFIEERWAAPFFLTELENHC